MNAELARHSVAKEREATNAVSRLYYTAEMNLIPAAWEVSETDRVNELLEETKNDQNRGFEWGCWHRLCHLDLMTLKAHTGPVYSAAFSPDGRRIVTGDNDKTAKVWDAGTGRELLTLKGHTGYVDSAVFSPDGKSIVTGSRNETAKIWLAE